MCFEALKSKQDDLEPPTPTSILKAGATDAAGTLPPKQTGISKTVNSPLTQGAAGAAGAGLAPLTGGLSMLIPVAAKLFGALLSKKPAPNFSSSLGVGGNPNAGLDALAQKSFGGF